MFYEPDGVGNYNHIDWAWHISDKRDEPRTWFVGKHRFIDSGDLW